MARKEIVIIGSGFSSLSAAGILAQKGHHITLLEKNAQPGGRARVWNEGGFSFDMGPSWYWMPEVFENYFNLFGKTTADFYTLKRLDPSYRIFRPGAEQIDVPASVTELQALFEKYEKGSAKKLEAFLRDAEVKYKTAMADYVFRLCDTVTEFFDAQLLLKSLQLNLFSSLQSLVQSKFRHPALVSMLQFPSLFLGAEPGNTPALYSLMNYADLKLGTWYPVGGMYKIVEAMVQIAESNGVEIKLNTEVTNIKVTGHTGSEVYTNNDNYKADVIIAGSDYHHTEQKLLDEEHRRYNNEYWENREMAPSAYIIYLGVDRKLPGLLHHNLFFDEDFEQHAFEIYSQPQWPSAPLFYVCAPSKTDESVAPAGMENLFVLMPLAAGINDNLANRQAYFDLIISRIEKRIGVDIRPHIKVVRSYCINDFKKDYHAFKGNAYGLANTLKQTAVFKPKVKSNKVKNLFYTGQLTVPGPGVPPAIISGQIVAGEVLRQISKQML